MESKCVECVESFLEELQEMFGNAEKKKRQEKKNQKEKEWLDIRQEVNKLVQDINFDQPMEEERDESMEIKGDESVKDSSLDNSQENTSEQLEDTSLVNFSMLLLMMYQKYRELNSVEQVNKAPIVQPLDCGEEKSPLPVSFYLTLFLSHLNIKIIFCY